MATRQIRRLLRKFEPVVQDAFLASVAEIVSGVVMAELIDALRRGSIEEAIIAIHAEPAAFEAFRNARGSAYIGAGEDTVSVMPKTPRGRQLVVRFNTRALNAEQWLSEQSSQKVTRLSDEQTQVLRNALTDGLERGDNPITIARNVAGRIDKKTGRRVGGIIGLSNPQEEALRRARQELSSLETMNRFKARALRDRTLDRLINRAIHEQRPLTDAEIQQLLDRYSDRMLDFRARTIARTETMSALHAGKRQAYQQAIDEGSVSQQELRRVWDSTGDNKVRESHAAIDGEEVGWDEPYSNGLMYPGDQSGPPEEVINCRCDEFIRIDFLARVKQPRVSPRADEPPALPSAPPSLPAPSGVPIDQDRVAPRGRRS